MSTTEIQWETRLLDELAERIDYGHTASADPAVVGPKFLRITDIQNGQVDWNAVPYCPATRDELEKYRLRDGDIVFARTGNTTGKSFLLKQPPNDSVFASYLIRVRPSPLVEPRFLAHFFCTPNYWNQIEKNAQGAGQPGVNATRLKTLEIPLPPLPEQKRIADILDKADAIRRKRQEALQFRDRILKSTFLQMFGDPSTNPKKLPLRELGEFYVSPKDGTKCGPFGGALKRDEYTSTGVPVWNMDNICDDGSLVPKIRLWISQEKYDDLSSYSVRDGDVIISRAGTVGKMCVVRAGLKESIISTNLIRLRLNASLIPEFFVSLMIFFKGRVGRLKTGPDGAFTHMSTGVLDKLTFPYPSISAQRDYVSILEKMDLSTHRLATAVTEADELFNSLVQRAFKGELSKGGTT